MTTSIRLRSFLRHGLVAAPLLGACLPADEGGGPSLADFWGQWEGQPTSDGLGPDTLSVDADGQGTAVLHYVMSGSAWEVSLTFDAVPSDSGFDCAFECDDGDGDDSCAPYAFEADCVLVDDELRISPAPGWYPNDRIVLNRVND
jgi:hypothetical protein